MVARILSIAGSDSGGGAGVQADVRTISRLGAHAMTAITAITAQNSKSVMVSQIMTASLVIKQIDAVISDFGVDAIKIGMLGNAEIVNAVTDYVRNIPAVPIIFDPVMVATNGAPLTNDKAIAAMKSLIQYSALITPNLAEYEKLSNYISDGQYAGATLIKGGHGDGDVLTDRLIQNGKETMQWQSKRIDTRHSHGTGCTLSSAIATFMGQGMDMIEAIDKARQYVRESLECSPAIGSGHGPMGVPRL